MDWLNSIVKVEHPFLDLAALRSFLAKHGPIDAFLPCSSTVFVRYNSAQAAQSAYNAQSCVQGLRVFTFSQDPRLLDQYLALRSSKPEYSMGNRDLTLYSPYTPDSDAYTQIKIPRGPRSRIIQLQAPSSKASAPGGNTAVSTSTGSPAPKGPVRLTSHLYDTPSDVPGCLMESSTITAPATFRMANNIELRVAGEQFIFDLSKLEDDPKSIIELLKLASAERAHWMIVAAFYRRKGNACAAIKMMMALIQALNCQGVDTNQMKPAYLMLSGCEADLAKQAKESSSTHYTNSRAWLQKVYGTFDDPLDRRRQDKSILTTSSARSPGTNRCPEEVNVRTAKRPSHVPREPRNEKKRRFYMNQQHTIT